MSEEMKIIKELIEILLRRGAFKKMDVQKLLYEIDSHEKA